MPHTRLLRLRIPQILQGTAVAPVETRHPSQWIDARRALPQRIVAKESPTPFPILEMHEIEDFTAIGALAGKLLGGKVCDGAA